MKKESVSVNTKQAGKRMEGFVLKVGHGLKLPYHGA